MKTSRQYKAVYVTKKCEEWLKEGHTWVYAEEILKPQVLSLPDPINMADKLSVIGNVKTDYKQPKITDFPNGSVIDVFTEKGSYLGTGLLSLTSKIRIRIMSENCDEVFDEEFFKKRIHYAIDFRYSIMRKDFSCCRLIFGETDGLPGLTVDRYENLIVLQILSFGMELRKDLIIKSIIDELKQHGVTVAGVYERNESATRLLEGLEIKKGWYEKYPHVESANTTICENNIKYYVDIENGQKTGFFLDQKYNREAISKLAYDKRVLDCFTHTGSFALNAAKGGATYVEAVDCSKSALEVANQNAKLNGFDEKIKFTCADIFDFLPTLEQRNDRFDLIILDPPAFTKSRSTIKNAERGYKEINYRAMKALPKGGFLATCSCSHFMPHELFEKMLLDAANDAHVKLKTVEIRRQSPDHPVIMGVTESEYLKFYIFQII